MDHNVSRLIHADIVAYIAPQPAAHGIAVCMDQQYAEGGSGDCVDNLAVSHLQILEEEERAHGSGDSEDLVGIGNKEVSASEIDSNDSLRRRDHDHTEPREQQHSRSQCAGELPIIKPTLRVQTDVRSNDVNHAEPRCVVEHHVCLCKGWQNNIHAHAPRHKQQMLPFRQRMDQLIQERNQQIKQEEAARKITRHIEERKQHFQEALNGERLITAEEKYAPNHHCVEVPFPQQPEEFLPRNVGGTHKVPCNQHEAIDARLPAPAEQQEKIVRCIQNCFLNQETAQS